jgi:hypothetical protein
VTRVTKEYAEYARGTKNSRCGLCAHFVAPDKCKIVTGKISAQGWCQYFKRKADE